MSDAAGDGALSVGDSVGPYVVVGWLGAGGMGVVYRAHDRRLGRDVAIKLIAARLAPDSGRQQRFEQEARATSQLAHPNILALYDVGTHAGTPFTVSELLEGQTLRRRIVDGPVPPRLAIDCARQMAEGLAAAHDKGIVHRDIKPENVFLTDDGRIKILDFGVAKLTGGDDEARPPAVATDTAPGVMVGTTGYMSPEQVRGEAVDGRSDLFSLGTVLHEMLAGASPFARPTPAETMAAILKEEPTPPLPTTIATGVADVVARCLEKNRSARFQSARDLAFALAQHADDRATGSRVSDSPTRPGWRHPVVWAATAIAVLIAALWAIDRRPGDAPTPALFLSVLAPDGASVATTEAPAISPDGRRIAFVGDDGSGQRLIYIRELETAAAGRPVAGTAGASLPFWSPDSRSIGFFAQGSLKTLDLASGRIQTLADAGGARGGAWNRDDRIVFVPRPLEGPHDVHASGGVVTRLPNDAATARAWFPSFLPDGRHFLTFVVDAVPENSGIFIGSVDSPTRTRLVQSRSNGVFVPPHHLLFLREGALVAQALDLTTLALRGNATPVATAVGLNPITNQALFSVSGTGTLAFLGDTAGQSELVWVDRAGRVLDKPGPRGLFTTVSLSPDAGAVVYDVADARGASIDLWQLTFARGVPSRLTFNPGPDVFPLWSPDGLRIAYASVRQGPPQLFDLDARGGGGERLLQRAALPLVPTGWSGDGRLLIYNAIDPKTSGDIWALPLDGAPAFSVLATDADERYGALSPDGRWLSYISNETGAYEVYVRALTDASRLRMVSTGGGFQPHWRGDGRELFYLSHDKRLMSIAVNASASTFDLGPARPLFPTETRWLEIQATARSYAPAPDGQRFLVVNAVDSSAAISIVLHWASALDP